MTRVRSNTLFPLLAPIVSRRKREEDMEEEINPFPTRHAKHRRRKRCKNRVTCSRGTEIKQFSLRQNDTSQIDENSTTQNRRTMMEKSGDSANAEETKNDKHVTDGRALLSLGTNDRIQEHNGQTRRVNYDLIADTSRKYIEEGKSVIDARAKVFAKERNSSNTEDPWRLEEVETYEERIDELEFEDSSVPPWINSRSKDEQAVGKIDYADTTRSYDIYSAVDDQTIFHESLSTVLTKLFQSLRNSSVASSHDILKEINFVDATDEDPCQKWLNSRDKLEEAFLGTVALLPGCPCQYPSNIFYDDKLWDDKQRKYFRWRDVSAKSQRLDVYKPGAAYCVRSLLAQGSGSVAAQHCCYDRRRKLLTRGSGAGTSNFVSPEISPLLHERIDVLPWRLCKGDFSRYNGVRPPNNDNNCEPNPDDEEYQRQIDDRKYY